MSLNLLRAKMKKKKGIGGGHEKKNSDPTGLGMMAHGNYGSGLSNVGPSHVQIIGPAGAKEIKRKAVSVTTPPDIPSPSHQPRKVSLTAESPIHSSNRSTPTSPLVNNKLAGIPPGSREPNPSSSLGTSNGGTVFATPLPKFNIDEAPLDRQGIINITVNIQGFMAAISKLKKAMGESSDVLRTTTQSPDSPTNSEPSDAGAVSDEVLNHLSHLIEVVQTCLSEHSGMQSTEIRDTAKALTQTYNECKHENPGTCPSCNNAIDALITAFTNSVSEYLTGESPQNESYPVPPRELQSSRKGLERANLKGLSKSHDNLSAKYSSFVDLCQPFSEPIVEDIDHALFGIENSTEVAAKYIKIRMKYHKEIVAYLTKRAQIEQRYMNSMNALGKKTLSTLMEMNEEHPPPLSEIFMKSVEEDMNLSTTFNKTFNQQVNTRLIEPLEAKIQECDKTKKEMTNNWNKEKKKLNEAKTAMRNAMSRYRFLGQDLARVKSLLALDPYGKQAEKRKKEVSDLESKWQEAEQTYKTAVANCNDCQYQVHIAAQKSILCAYRRMVIDCDVQLQSGLEAYFRLQRQCFQSLPEPVDMLLEETGKYQIGSEFMAYIRRHPEQREEPEDYLFEEFDPESENLMEANENYMESSSLPNSTSTDSTFLNPGAEDAQEQSPSPFPSSSYGQQEHTTPTHGLSTGGELPRSSASVLSISSPRLPKKKRPHSELMELAVGVDGQKNSLIRRNSDHTSIQTSTKDSLSPPAIITQPQWQAPPQSSVVYSKNALTHTFKKLRGPARCRECDTYVYFHGHECETCGLACHKKCLESLAIRCGNKRLARKMNTFGVDFQKHLKATNRCIPIIVTKCIEEIDERALDTRGLYRISSAKTKLEHLCQLFESGADRVDLSDRPSHMIGSCLKLYFRQLPEPLLTFQHYHDFITFARECSYVLPCNLETATGEKKERALDMLDRLRGLLQALPFENYITLARLLYHLKKVSDPEHVKHNSMPPSNLGIVFGPNLLRQREQVASLALLADMTAQAKAIEIMISHAHELFQMMEEKIKEYEHERDDDNYTKEMLVGEEPYEHQEQTTKSPALLDFDDYLTTGSRTPYNTPPERRRENVYELGEVLEALQLQSVGRKNMEGEQHKPMSGLRDHPMSASLPSFSPLNLPRTGESEESTLTSLGRFLRSPAAPNPGPVEKMLTPVEEKPIAEHEQDHTVLNSSDDEEEDDFIVSVPSNKIDGPSLSRSGSGFSNPGPTFYIDSEKDGLWDAEGAARSGDLRSPKDRDIGLQVHEEHKEMSSQSSEDSNTFEEGMPANLRSFFAEISSSAEETPKLRSLDSGKQRHSVLSVSESSSSPFHRNIYHRSGSSPQKSQSLRGRYSAPAQHASPTSFNISSAIVKGGSFSEKSRTKKYSISEKYAKYEQCRSERELQEDTKSKDSTQKNEGEEDFVPAEDSTEKTVGEEDGLGEVTDDMEEEKDGTDHTSDAEEGQKEEGEVSESPEEGMELNRRLLEVREVGSVAKQCDSGVDTPESFKSFKDGVRRLSMPPFDDEVQLADEQPLSHTAAFASRESGIADSPIPDQTLDDNTLPKAQESPLQQQCKSLPSQSQPVMEDLRDSCDGEESTNKEASQANPLTARHSSCVEIIVPEEGEESDKSTPVVRRRICSSFSVERDRGSSVPRSLESPTFSRYARTPIRDSKLLRASDPQSIEGSSIGLRFRSVSMDKIPTTYMDSKTTLRADDNDDESRPKAGSENIPSMDRSGIRRAKSPGMPNSLSTSFIPYHPLPPQSLGLTSAAGSGGAKQSMAMDGHPSRRYCVNSPPESATTSPPPHVPQQASPSHMSGSSTQSAPSTPLVEMSFESPSSSPLSRRKAKIGKGLKQKLKPALRVFKITSSASSDLSQSEILSHTPPLEEDEDGNEKDVMVSSTKSCTGADIGPEIRMIRMVSPEAVEERLQSSKGYLRRSHSSEDILDVSADDDEDDEEQRGGTKIGGLVVVPEPKHKSRGKIFFNKMKLKKTGSPRSASPQLTLDGSQVGKGIASESEAKGSPILLAYGYVAQSDGTGMKSPKNPKKRQRTPQYV